MKPVRNLLALWRAFPRSQSIKAAPVPANDLDFRMLPEPICGILRGTLWLHVDDLPTLQIDNDRSISFTFSPSPIVYTNHS
jgi:hypothetical protein